MAWLAGFAVLGLLIAFVIAFAHGRVQSKIIGGLQHDGETKDRKIERLEAALALARQPAFDDDARRRMFEDEPAA